MNTQALLKDQLKKNIPDIRPGQVVRVHEKIQEGDKSRVQVFEGLVIATKHGKGLDGTFTVRKIGAGGIGVERIFPIHMPAIEKIEVLRKENVRRAKLYYVREQIGKKTKKRKTKLQELVFDMSGGQEPEEETSEDIVESVAEETEEKSTEAEAEIETEEIAGPEAEQSETEEETKEDDEKEIVENTDEEAEASQKETEEPKKEEGEK